MDKFLDPKQEELQAVTSIQIHITRKDVNFVKWTMFPLLSIFWCQNLVVLAHDFGCFSRLSEKEHVVMKL